MQYTGAGENSASNNSQSMQLVTDKSGITLTTHREERRRDRHTGHKGSREREILWLQAARFFNRTHLFRSVRLSERVLRSSTNLL